MANFAQVCEASRRHRCVLPLAGSALLIRTLGIDGLRSFKHCIRTVTAPGHETARGRPRLEPMDECRPPDTRSRRWRDHGRRPVVQSVDNAVFSMLRASPSPHGAGRAARSAGDREDALIDRLRDAVRLAERSRLFSGSPAR